jgi:hypothetical protein
MANPMEALARLSRQDPTSEYFAAFHIEVNAEQNQRGAAILLACNTEIGLRYAIKRHLVPIEDEDTERTLFHSGPLRSFDAKIRMGYVMRLYGDQTRNNLDCIRFVRNAFAHATIPISFDTPEVKAVCDLMTMPEILPPRIVGETGRPKGILPDFPPTRKRFQAICEAVAHNLFVLILSRPNKSGAQQIQTLLP